MPRPSERGRRWAQRVHLAASAPRGRIGDRSVRGVGGSLEFEERREYEPGDDVRRVDWPAYARTDQLYTRLYSQEIAPRVELLVDDSRSIGHDEDKASLAMDLVFALASAALNEGSGLRVVALGDEPRSLEFAELEGEGLSFAGQSPLDDVLRRAGRHLVAGSVRILVSDFLIAARPEELVRRLADGAGRLILLQVYGSDDVEPARGGELRLVDAETGAEIELRLDEGTLAHYQERRQRLEEGLAQEARRARGLWLSLQPPGEDDDVLAQLARHGVWSLS